MKSQFDFFIEIIAEVYRIDAYKEIHIYQLKRYIELANERFMNQTKS